MSKFISNWSSGFRGDLKMIFVVAKIDLFCRFSKKNIHQNKKILHLYLALTFKLQFEFSLA